MVCNDWKGYDELDVSDALSYRFSSRKKQADNEARAFLIFFGKEDVVSQPTVFGVGDNATNYTVEVIVKVVDKLGDYWQLKQDVQVFEMFYTAQLVL